MQTLALFGLCIKHTYLCTLFYILFLQDNKWLELDIRIPNSANLLSDGIKENMIYALVSGDRRLCEINLKTKTVNYKPSSCGYDYNFGSLYDGLLINTGYEDFIVIGRFYYRYEERRYNGSYYQTEAKYQYYWYAYSYAQDKWVNLNQWEQNKSSGISLIFDPETYHLFYYVNEKETLECIDLTDSKIKDKKLYIEEGK